MKPGVAERVLRCGLYHGVLVSKVSMGSNRAVLQVSLDYIEPYNKLTKFVSTVSKIMMEEYGTMFFIDVDGASNVSELDLEHLRFAMYSQRFLLENYDLLVTDVEFSYECPEDLDEKIKSNNWRNIKIILHSSCPEVIPTNNMIIVNRLIEHLEENKVWLTGCVSLTFKSE